MAFLRIGMKIPMGAIVSKKLKLNFHRLAHALLALVVILSSLRIAMSFFVLLIVAMGYGVVKPNVRLTAILYCLIGLISSVRKCVKLLLCALSYLPV
jgi:hypothetical protein